MKLRYAVLFAVLLAFAATEYAGSQVIINQNLTVNNTIIFASTEDDKLLVSLNFTDCNQSVIVLNMTGPRNMSLNRSINGSLGDLAYNLTVYGEYSVFIKWNSCNISGNWTENITYMTPLFNCTAAVDKAEYIPREPVRIISNLSNLAVVDPRNVTFIVNNTFTQTRVEGNYTIWKGQELCANFSVINPYTHSFGLESVQNTIYMSINSTYLLYYNGSVDEINLAPAILPTLSFYLIDPTGSIITLNPYAAGALLKTQYTSSAAGNHSVYITYQTPDYLYIHNSTIYLNATETIYIDLKRTEYMPFEPVQVLSNADNLTLIDPNGEKHLILVGLDDTATIVDTKVIGNYTIVLEDQTKSFTVLPKYNISTELSESDGRILIHMTPFRKLYDNGSIVQDFIDYGAIINYTIIDPLENVLVLVPIIINNSYTAEIIAPIIGNYSATATFYDGLVSFNEEINFSVDYIYLSLEDDAIPYMNISKTQFLPGEPVIINTSYDNVTWIYLNSTAELLNHTLKTSLFGQHTLTAHNLSVSFMIEPGYLLSTTVEVNLTEVTITTEAIEIHYAFNKTMFASVNHTINGPSDTSELSAALDDVYSTKYFAAESGNYTATTTVLFDNKIASLQNNFSVKLPLIAKNTTLKISRELYLPNEPVIVESNADSIFWMSPNNEIRLAPVVNGTAAITDTPETGAYLVYVDDINITFDVVMPLVFNSTLSVDGFAVFNTTAIGTIWDSISKSPIQEVVTGLNITHMLIDPYENEIIAIPYWNNHSYVAYIAVIPGNYSYSTIVAYGLNKTKFTGTFGVNESVAFNDSLISETFFFGQKIEQTPARVGIPVNWTISSATEDKMLIPFAAKGIKILENNRTVDKGKYRVSSKIISADELSQLRMLKNEIDSIDSEGLISSIAGSIRRRSIENSASDIDPSINIETIDSIELIIDDEIQDADYTVEYQTPAPEKFETMGSSMQLQKRVKVFSDLHYRNVSVSTSIVESVIKPRLYHFINGIKTDITDVPHYSVNYVDYDNNGLYDQIEWIVPHLSDQYFEVGLATINTHRSIYRPGDTAQIVAVVLNTNGYLVSDAQVNITVVTPANITHLYTTDTNSVIETEKGVYRTNHTNTGITGIYNMVVDAKGNDVNNTMASSFDVRSFIPYDIIREIPATTDPWMGGFYSKIQVISYNASNFTLTEKIPINFTIIDAANASIITTADHYLLSWNLTNNSIVRIRIRPPLITPDLYEIGRVLIAEPGFNFTEFRPWYLAVDPVETEFHYCIALTSSGNEANDATGTCAEINASGDYLASDDDLKTRNQGSANDWAIAEVTFDSLTQSGLEVTSATLRTRWYASDTTVNTCEIQVDNGTGYTTMSTTCYGGPIAYHSYNVSSYIATSDEANGFKIRWRYFADNGNDYIYIDYAILEINVSTQPHYSQWGLNVSNGAAIVRGQEVIGYAYWNHTDGITDALLEHNGNGTFKNYTIPSPYTNNWTNYTLNTSDTVEFNGAGKVDVIAIYAKDVDGYKKTTPAKWFFIYDYSNISSSSISPSTLNQSESADMLCRVMDYHLNSPIEDYSVFFYRNGTYMTSIKTNSTGWAKYTATYNTPGNYNITCNISSSGYYYIQSGANYDSQALTVYDNSVPSISLLDMLDGYETTMWPVWSNFSAIDTYSGIQNCTIEYYNESGFIMRANFSSVAEGAETGYSMTKTGYDNITWNVKCYDDSVNLNFQQTSNRTYRVIEDKVGPVVDLTTPPDDVSTNENVSFIFNATDKLSDILNCTIYIDNIANASNISMVEGMHTNLTVYEIDTGVHTWQVKCWDNSPNKNQGVSSVYEFTVGQDNTGPAIVVQSPANLTTDTDGNTDFRFTADDFQNDVKNCSLYINGTRNQTNSSIVDGVNSYFSLSSMAEKSYTWFIMCFDDSANENQANSSVYTLYVNYDFANPLVILQSPDNDFQSITGNLVFVYNVTDESAIANCSLLINGTINQTNYSISKGQLQNFSLFGMQNNDYYWTVNCTDDSDSHNWSAPLSRNFSVGPDTIGPQVTLYAPLNATTDTDGDITFTYSVYDVTSGVDSCTVYVDGSLADTDNSITEQITQSLTTTLGDGSYTWYINCTDDSPQQNKGQSEVRFLNVTITFETKYSISMYDGYVSVGELMDATGNLKDSTDNDIQGATAYAYIVENIGTDNQTLPWLDSTFLRRIEVNISKSGNDISDSPINLTIDTATLITAGRLNSDCSDLRFGDQANNNLIYYFYDADNLCNSATTKVIVKTNTIWDSESHMLGMYFNKSSASATSTRSASPLIDNFDNEDTFASGYWVTDFDAGNPADEWQQSSVSAQDGTNGSMSRINCNNQCTVSPRLSDFYRSIEVETNSTLYWTWRVENANAQLYFYLDGTQEATTTSTAFTSTSFNIPAGSHEIKFRFENDNNNQNYDGFVDQIFLIANGITQGTSTTQSEYVDTLASDTTDASGNAQFTWDTTGQSYGNYSITGYATKGSYWPDNGYYSFYLGPDTEIPQPLQWGLNVSIGHDVVRGQSVHAYSYWYDKVNLSHAFIQHDGNNSEVNYSISWTPDRYAWANYTLNTSELTEFNHVGRINVTAIHVNDTTDNWNKTSPLRWFEIYGKGEINYSQLNTSELPQEYNFTFWCQVRDEFTGQAIQNHPVSFYFNGTFKENINTDSAGNASKNINATVVGLQPVECRINNWTAGYYFKGTINSNLTYINVTDNLPPTVEPISPSNESVKTIKIVSFSVRPTDDTLDSCTLYGDWFGGWHAEETRSDFTSGSINFFSAIDLYNGQFYWYVTCNDSLSNTGTSGTRWFNISISAPTIALQVPVDDTVRQSPTNEVFRFYVADKNDLDNCSLYINNVRNATNYSLAVNNSYNFTEYISYGSYNWSVKCFNNQSIEGQSDTYQLYVMGWAIDSPSNLSNIDRDESHPTYGLDTNIVSRDLGGAVAANVSFFVNLSYPGFGSLSNIGWNLSNASGRAGKVFNPTGSYYVGYYEVFTNATDYNAISFNTTYVNIFGALNLYLLGKPANKYNLSDNVTIEANISVLGPETLLQMNNTYLNYFNATMRSPTGAQIIDLPLTLFSNNWTASYNLSTLTEVGEWNLSLGASAQYHYNNVSSWRLVNITDNVPPAITLVHPDNQSYLTYNITWFNFTVMEYFNDTCELWGNWSAWHLNKSINYSSGSNTFGTLELADGNYIWNVRCNDTSGNTGWADNYTFTVDTGVPQVTLYWPGPNSLLPTGDHVLNYTVIDADNMSNCTLLINGAMNQTNYSIGKSKTNNFSINLDYGTYTWRINCSTENNQSGLSSSWLIYVPLIELLNPANSTIVDRDSVSAITDILNITINITPALTNVNISYHINISGPLTGSEMEIGNSNTNASGIATLVYDPPSSLDAGNYSWWARIENSTENSSSRFFYLFGSINVTFYSGINPNPSYNKPKNMTIQAVIDQRGSVTDDELNASYNAQVNATIYMTNLTNLTLILGYNVTYWNATYEIPVAAPHGLWNVSLSTMTDYMYVILEQNRSIIINSTTDISIEEVIGLKDYACLISYFNPFTVNISNQGYDAVDNFTLELYMDNVLNRSKHLNLSSYESQLIVFNFSDQQEHTFNITLSANVSPSYGEQIKANNNYSIYNITRDNLKMLMWMEGSSNGEDKFRQDFAVLNEVSCSVNNSLAYASVENEFNTTGLYPTPQINTFYTMSTSYAWMFNLSSGSQYSGHYNVTGLADYHLRYLNLFGK